MIIVDNALKAREAQGKPIRGGMIGAGFMGRALANQIVHSVPGERLWPSTTGTSTRPSTPFSTRPWRPSWRVRKALDDAIRRGKPVVTEDPFLLCRSELVDCLVDVTGAVEFGVQVVMEAFKHRKHECS